MINLILALSMTSSMSDALEVKSNKFHEGGLLYVEVSKKHVVTQARCEKAWDKAVILCKPFSMIPINDECKELSKKQIAKKKQLNFDYLCLVGN